MKFLVIMTTSVGLFLLLFFPKKPCKIPPGVIVINEMNQMGEQRRAVSARMIVLVMVIVAVAGVLGLALSAGAAQQQTGAGMLALIPAAFLSGVLSFLSPCSLPILPAYFAYSFQSSKHNIVLMTTAFFLGLAATMTVLGASVSALGSLLVRNISLLTFIGGGMIIVFGILSFLGKGFSGVQFNEKPAGTVAGSFIYGATFAIGWTACIGPILGLS